MVLDGPTCPRFAVTEVHTVLARLQVVDELGASSMLHIPQVETTVATSEDLRGPLRKVAIAIGTLKRGVDSYRVPYADLVALVAPTHPWVKDKSDKGDLTVADVEGLLNGAAVAQQTAQAEPAPVQSQQAATQAPAGDAPAKRKMKPRVPGQQAAQEPVTAAPQQQQQATPAPQASQEPAKRKPGMRPAVPGQVQAQPRVQDTPAPAASGITEDTKKALVDLRDRVDFLGGLSDKNEALFKSIGADLDAIGERLDVCDAMLAWLYRQTTGDANFTVEDISEVDWSESEGG